MKMVIENINIEVKGFFEEDMSDEDFFNFCKQNTQLRIERNAEKQIFIMAPVNTIGGNQNFSIALKLGQWNEQQNNGICFDSSTGFTLSDGSVLSPDASWMPLEKWEKLSIAEKEKFASVCPDFVIELKSKSDNLNTLKNKMLKWIENGTRLAWLIDTANKQVFIYRADDSIEIIKGFNNKLSGENVLPGFKLDLQILQ